MTMWNQTIPDALRGRLASIEMVSYMSGPLLGDGALAQVSDVGELDHRALALGQRRERILEPGGLDVRPGCGPLHDAFAREQRTIGRARVQGGNRTSRVVRRRLIRNCREGEG